MVEFMKLHPDLAKGHLNVSNAKSKCRELWQRLSQDLNAAGPPSHEVEKWKKVCSYICMYILTHKYNVFANFRYGQISSST